jgi:hypothetical protein
MAYVPPAPSFVRGQQVIAGVGSNAHNRVQAAKAKEEIAGLDVVPEPYRKAFVNACQSRSAAFMLTLARILDMIAPKASEILRARATGMSNN